MANGKKVFDVELYEEERLGGTIFLPSLQPPKEYVIQGIRKPELKPKPCVAEGEAALRDWVTVGRTRILSSCNGRRFGEHVNSQKNISEHQRRSEDAQDGLCKFWDFHDKKYGYCLIKRLNGKDSSCLYNSPIKWNNKSSKNFGHVHPKKREGWLNIKGSVGNLRTPQHQTWSSLREHI